MDPKKDSQTFEYAQGFEAQLSPTRLIWLCSVALKTHHNHVGGCGPLIEHDESMRMYGSPTQEAQDSIS